MKHLSITSIFLLGVLLSFAQATNLTLDANKNLRITDQSGAEVASLASGSISEKVTADGQNLKISFGQDLNNRHTIIIYPDPDAPQALSFTLLDKAVSMSADSVLTVTASQDGSMAEFQAGVLGQITVAGSPVSPGGSVNLQNGQVAIANTSAPLFEDVMVDEPEPVVDATAAASTNVNAEAERLISEFDRGLVVKEVTGTVMMAPAGTNVIDLLRNSTSLPKLQAGDVIPSGASIRTDFGATMIVAQSPGVTMQVLENTDMLIEENNYALQNGVEKRSFRANLKKGGVINNLEGVDPNNTKYEIQTPLAVAAARGTAYSVFTSNNITVVITGNGEVEVIARGGTYRTLSGQKTVVTFDPGTGEERTAEFGATAEELQIIQNLIAAAEALNAQQNVTGSGGRRVTDDRGLTKTDESGGGGTQDDQTFFDRADPNDPNQYQNDLDAAVDSFLETFQPRLNPGAITPIQSGQ